MPTRGLDSILPSRILAAITLEWSVLGVVGVRRCARINRDVTWCLPFCLRSV